MDMQKIKEDFKNKWMFIINRFFLFNKFIMFSLTIIIITLLILIYEQNAEHTDMFFILGKGIVARCK